MSASKKHVTRCPCCGGALVYEEFYQVTHQYRLKKDGTISDRWKRSDEMDDETDMLYCSECRTVFDNFFIDWRARKIYIPSKEEESSGKDVVE